jgi:8-oxo-dGTP pyrophosphatase MutT (NUDIX family)
MPERDQAVGLAANFTPSPEEAKSRELILALLENTRAPFSRDQFHPGHITCTALVLHPDGRRVLLVHHRRLRRWLLPGGHVEEHDSTLADAAQREAVEETAVRIATDATPLLVGMDVHGIPANKAEPFHLHHDLIFILKAEGDEIISTEEAPGVAWCGTKEVDQYSLPDSIVRAFRRAALRLTG